MQIDNLLTPCVDTENMIIQSLDIQSLMHYAQISKNINIFIKKNKLYRKLIYFYQKVVKKNRYQAKKGMTLINWASIRRQPATGMALIDWASKYGHIDILELIAKSNVKLVHNMYGYCSCCLFFLVKSDPTQLIYSEYGLAEASRNGHLNILEWWLKNKLDVHFSELAIRMASMNGHVHILEWLVKQYINMILYSKYSVNWASSNGHQDVLEWWLQLSRITGVKLRYTEWAMDVASKNGHVHILQWWLESGLKLEYTSNALDEARIWGRREVLNWWAKSGLLK